jgi:hypothetical protein
MTIPYVPTTPDEMLEMLRLMQAQIPQYTQLPPADEKSLRRVAHVNPDWIQHAINAAGASPTLQGAIGITDQELRAESQDIANWSSVEAELEATMKGIHSATIVRKHRLGLVALQIYTIGKQLLRRPEHVDLIPFIQQLQTANIFGPRLTRKPKARPTVDPAPGAASETPNDSPVKPE